MRAFMSTFGRRQTAVRDGFASDSAAFASMAEREARAILAVTEPALGRHLPTEQYESALRYAARRIIEAQQMKRALAEALAAFVGDAQ